MAKPLLIIAVFEVKLQWLLQPWCKREVFAINQFLLATKRPLRGATRTDRRVNAIGASHQQCGVNMSGWPALVLST